MSAVLRLPCSKRRRIEGFQPQQQNSSAAFSIPLPSSILLDSSLNPKVMALETLKKTLERNGMPCNGWRKAESSISVIKTEQTNVRRLLKS